MPAGAGGGAVAPSRVAYQGEPGAFSEEAAWLALPPPVSGYPCPTFADVARALAAGHADYGILPLRNSIAGPVEESLGVLAAGGLVTVREIILPVVLCLLAPPDAGPHQIRRVLSHPVALAQCANFLARYGWEAVPAHDTAGAARLVADAGDPRQAAVASRAAARHYGLRVLAQGIADLPDNRTTFALVQADHGGAPGGSA